jgi:hypothetical protein
MRRFALAFALVATLALAASASAANIVVLSDDPAGTGLFDPTPAAPVGGNPGTTIGAQRAFVYLFSAARWGATVESDVDIFVLASFRPLACTATAGTLGSAGASFVHANFTNAPVAEVWYPTALADALAGVDLVPGNFDISSSFNSSIDNPAAEPTCLTGRNWYYGIDHNGGTDFDFLNVVSHEIAHGLGFANFVTETTGANFSGRSDIYSVSTLDVTTGQTWNLMTNAERAASAVRNGKVVWNGPSVTGQASSFLGPRPSVIALQGPAAGSHEAVPASFGPPIVAGDGTTGNLRLANDGVGVASDACEPLINNVSDKIVLADRGACTFNVKVANAQAAGAKGVVIADNVPGGSFPGMGGVDPTITIPSMGVTFELGQQLRSAHTVVKLRLDPSVQAGTQDGFVRLYAPTVVALGSSISHYDTTANPNLLMEPFITNTLRAADTFDLTPALFEDIGWVLAP